MLNDILITALGIFFLIYFKPCVPICVSGRAFECQCTYVLDEAVVFTDARVTGDCEMPYMGCENSVWVFWKRIVKL